MKKAFHLIYLVFILSAWTSYAQEIVTVENPMWSDTQLEVQSNLINSAAELATQGYHQWTWSTRDGRATSEFVIIPVHEDLLAPRPMAYLAALSAKKTELIALYEDTKPVTDAEYILLAHMAVGFLGNESDFFSSPRYALKESCIFCVNLIKRIRAIGPDNTFDATSRGPIQMKDVPDLIQTTYGIDVRDLNDPENAVLAIMGYLIEALHQLKQSAANNGCTQIHSETYVDYLPYIYTGRTEKIRDCSARPWELGYVTRIKEYMNYVMVFTR